MPRVEREAAEGVDEGESIRARRLQISQPQRPALEQVRDDLARRVPGAPREESGERLAEEAADVLYHLAVLLRSRGLGLADAEKVLLGRRRLE